jgi:quinol monooxygenase YgiN
LFINNTAGNTERVIFAEQKSYNMKTSILTALVAFMLVMIIGCTNKKAGVADNQPAADSVKKMITARIYIKPGFVNQFINEARYIIDSSNMEPGCESYMLYQNPYDSTKLIFVEVWKNQAAVDNHFSMSYFKAFGPKTKEWLSQDTELNIVSVVPSK